VRVLVLGYGSMGRRRVAHAIVSGHDVRVYDTRRTDIPDAQMIRPGEIGDWRPEAVIVATPAAVHAGLFRQHRQSSHVLVEKPLALSIQDYGVSVRSETHLAVGYNLRFHPGLRLMRSQVHSVGRPLYAHFRLRCLKRSWPGADYSDMLLEGSHELDLALWMLGPARVVGAGGHGDCWTVLLRHDSGCISTVLLDGQYRGLYERSVKVVGTDGELDHVWLGHSWRWVLAATTGVPQRAGTTTPDETYAYESAAFFAACAGETSVSPACSVTEALDVLRLCDAARVSAR
jgi:predicted dehydrogenase